MAGGTDTPGGAGGTGGGAGARDEWEAAGAPDAPRPPERKPRKGLRRALYGCGGCLVLFVVLLVVALLMLPSLLGAWVADEIELAFDEECAGSLEIDELSLGWSSEQVVEGARILDPDGGIVATVDARLPSILSLSDGMSKWDRTGRLRLGKVELDVSADVVTDEQGVTNLERALAPPHADHAGHGGAGAPSGGGQADPELLRMLREADFELLVHVRSLAWTDRRPGAPGPIRLEGGEASVRLEKGEPLRVASSGRLAGAGSGAFRLEGRASEPRIENGELDWKTMTGTLELDGVGTALVDAFVGPGPSAAELLGPSVDGRVIVRRLPGARAAEVGVTLDSARLAASGTFRLEDTLLRSLDAAERAEQDGQEGEAAPADGEAPPAFDARLELAAGDLGARLGAPLPEGASLTAGEGAALRLVLRSLRVDLGADDLPAAAAFDAWVRADALRYRARPGAPELALLAARANVDAAPGAPLNVQASADLAPRGSATVRASVAGGLPALADPATARASLHVSAEQVPTALVDDFAQQDGLLVEVLGDSLQLFLDAPELGADGGAAHARLRSPNGAVEWRGALRDGRIESGEDGFLEAEAGLGPLLSKRVVGPLVPLLVDLSKPAGASPLKLRMTDYSVPLDGALQGLDADLRLDLGEVTYRLLPGLGELAGRAAQAVAGDAKLAPFGLHVTDGRVHYDGLPIPLGGQSLTVRGDLVLAGGKLDLKAELPLSALRGDVGKELESVRELLDPNTVVPLEIGGSLGSPKLRLGSGFAESALKQAAKEGLRRQLEQGAKKDLEAELKKRLGKLFGDG